MTKYVLNFGDPKPARNALRRRRAGGLPIHAMEEGRFVFMKN